MSKVDLRLNRRFVGLVNNLQASTSYNKWDMVDAQSSDN